MDINKRDDETPLQYHRRLVRGKLVDQTLADIDYAELSEHVYGKPYSSDSTRKMMYGSEKTLELLDTEELQRKSSNGKYDSSNIGDELDEKLVEFKSEQQKFFDQRNAFNKAVRDRSREEELNDIIATAIKESKLPVLNYNPIHIEQSDKTLLVSLNDIHYGIEISNAWNQYNPDICAEMMRSYLNKVIDIAKLHNCDECVVYNCGDNISGKIHFTIQIANRENVISQIQGVSELIAEFLSELSKHFNYIRYVSVPGNHTRLDTKDNSPYDERLDDLVDWYLEARLKELLNIEICTYARIDPTFSAIDIRGKLYCVVHGDFDDSDTKIAGLQLLLNRPIYAVLSGHKHFNKISSVQGIKTVQSGAFIGTDGYTTTKRLFGRPEQLVSVCDDTGIICYYDVPLKD